MVVQVNQVRTVVLYKYMEANDIQAFACYVVCYAKFDLGLCASPSRTIIMLVDLQNTLVSFEDILLVASASASHTKAQINHHNILFLEAFVSDYIYSSYKPFESPVECV